MAYIALDEHLTACLSRIRTVQNATLTLLAGYAELVDTITNWRSNYVLADDPQWQALQRQVDHIYRTYRRL